MNAIDAKPCPFCGCEAIEVLDDGDGWVVQCSVNPDVCPMRVVVLDAPSAEAAIEAWNKRGGK